MAAVNGEISVTDNLVVSGGAVRDKTVASGSVVASKMMAKGNVEERLQVPANGGEETFFSPVKMVANGESELKRRATKGKLRTARWSKWSKSGEWRRCHFKECGG